MSSISAVINVTQSEISDLKHALRSVRSLVDEIILIDMASGVNLTPLAHRYQAKIYPHELIPVVEPARNFGISKATCDWVLLLDPDERLTPELKLELKRISNRDDIDYVRIPRKNIIFKKWLHYSGSWPDYLIRFFRKGTVTWSSKIHSQPNLRGNGLSLQEEPDFAIKHYNYKSVSAYLSKALRYSHKKAKELLQNQNYHFKLADLLLKPIQEFNSRYFNQKGYKDGLPGLVFCLLQASQEILIYSLVWDQSKDRRVLVNRKSLISAFSQAIYEFGHWYTSFLFYEYTKNPLKFLIFRLRQLLNRITKNL